MKDRNFKPVDFADIILQSFNEFADAGINQHQFPSEYSKILIKHVAKAKIPYAYGIKWLRNRLAVVTEEHKVDVGNGEFIIYTVEAFKHEPSPSKEKGITYFLNLAAKRADHGSPIFSSQIDLCGMRYNHRGSKPVMCGYEKYVNNIYEVTRNFVDVCNGARLSAGLTMKSNSTKETA